MSTRPDNTENLEEFAGIGENKWAGKELETNRINNRDLSSLGFFLRVFGKYWEKFEMLSQDKQQEDRTSNHMNDNEGGFDDLQ